MISALKTVGAFLLILSVGLALSWVAEQTNVIAVAAVLVAIGFVAIVATQRRLRKHRAVGGLSTPETEKEAT